MKKLLTMAAMVALTVSLIAVNAEARSIKKTKLNSQEIMKKLAEEAQSVFDEDYAIEQNLIAKLIKKPKKLNGRLVKKIKELEKETFARWKEAALDPEGEYSEETPERRKEIANNPKKFLEVEHLMEIIDFYKVTNKEGKVVGYVIHVVDYMQSSFYQDGAWVVIYTDEKFNVVSAYEGSA